jgi:uncharacterized delta-60 repeat protein
MGPRRNLLAAFSLVLLVLAAGLAVASSAFAASMVVQPDGKIVLAGTTPLSSGYLARLLPDGEPDPSFGVGGVAVDHRLGGIGTVSLEPDGSILAAGSSWRIARYSPEGQLDTSFGADGYAGLNVIDRVDGLVTLPDGRIVAGGNQTHKLFPSEALLVLISADGRTQEWVSGASFRTYMTGLVGNGDGSVLMLAGGEEELGRKSLLTRFVPGSTPSYGNNYSTISYPPPAPVYDKGFGGGAGIVGLSWPGAKPPAFRAHALASTASGIFVAAGVGSRLALVRLSNDGVFDGSFSSGGYATIDGRTGSRGTASSVLVTPAGKVVMLGDFRRPRPGVRCEFLCKTPLLAQFLPDGRRDSSFGSGGIARLPGLRGPSHGAEAGDLALLGNGKILATARGSESTSRVFLGRFRPNGTADSSFGEGGVLRFQPCAGSGAGQRESGCLPSAQAALEVRRAPGGRVSLRLEVNPRDDWWDIGSLRVQLPASLSLRRGQAHRATFSYRIYGDRPWRQPGQARGGTLVFVRTRGMEPGPISLTVPPGVLRRVGPLPATLSLHVQVGFSPGYRVSAGTQNLVVSEN